MGRGLRAAGRGGIAAAPALPLPGPPDRRGDGAGLPDPPRGRDLRAHRDPVPPLQHALPAPGGQGGGQGTGPHDRTGRAEMRPPAAPPGPAALLAPSIATSPSPTSSTTASAARPWSKSPWPPPPSSWKSGPGPGPCPSSRHSAWIRRVAAHRPVRDGPGTGPGRSDRHRRGHLQPRHGKRRGRRPGHGRPVLGLRLLRHLVPPGDGAARAPPHRRSQGGGLHPRGRRGRHHPLPEEPDRALGAPGMRAGMGRRRLGDAGRGSPARASGRRRPHRPRGPALPGAGRDARPPAGLLRGEGTPGSRRPGARWCGPSWRASPTATSAP